jgi:hypothetical protein
MTHALTVIAEIDHARRAELEAAIGRFKASDLPDTHFTRLVIVDDDDKKELPALLAWESNHDGEVDDYLRACLDCASLDAVFACCRGYPGAVEPAAFLRWMTDHSHRAAAFYAAYRDVPKRQVDNDIAVHDAIRDVIDRPGMRAELAKLAPDDIRARIAEIVGAERPDLDLTPQPEPSWLGPRVALVVGGLLLLPLIVPVGIVLALLTRSKELSDPPGHKAWRPVHDDKRHQEDEDVAAQNQLTHLVDLKPGRIRIAACWSILTFVDLVARTFAVDGALGGITDIHFARWVILLDPRENVRRKRHRLLFFSNYDGSWESYLGEFVDRAAPWLTAVWSHAVDFPTAKWVFFEGATDEESFKQWARNHQVKKRMWWTGVPHSTVQNVRNDTWIRRRLNTKLDHDEAKQWLMRL